MDHQAFAQLLGNYGEFVGALAVVATLGYLVVQVKQNTKALETSIQLGWVGISSDVHKITAENPALYGQIYWDQNRHWSDLSAEEKAAHFAIWNQTMNTYECIFLSRIAGAVDEAAFDTKMRNLAWFLNTNTLHWNTWENTGQHVFDLRFVDYVNTLRPPKEVSIGS